MADEGVAGGDDREPGDGDEIEINLRPPQEAAERLIVLGTVCRRAFLEERPEGVEDDAPEAERFDLASWLRDEGVEGAATSRERRLLATPVGRLEPDKAAAASWQTEALVMLGWALRLVDEVPPYDAVADPTALLRAVPAPWETTGALRRDTRLRDEGEIAVERERAELWHWRARVASLVRDARGAERAELLAAITEVAREAAAAGLVTPLIVGDFPVRGRAYGETPAALLPELDAIAAERLAALNWLCGFGASWDDVPLDV